MAIDDGYCTLNQLKSALQITLTVDDYDGLLEAAIEAASRQIDGHCARNFLLKDPAVARSYYPVEARWLGVDDISSTTDLVVEVDEDDDGTFETTLTIDDDFIVAPVNAAAETPARPFEEIRLLDGTLTGFSRLSSGRPYVQVTAQFGWPAIPGPVERACVLQAKNIYKAPDLTWGSFQLSDEGTPLRAPPLDPIARAQLENFVRWTEVNDG